MTPGLRTVCVLASATGLAVALANAGDPFEGGFVEKGTDAPHRPPLTAAQIQSFLPERGRFTFPAPYGTTGVRITNPSDCGGGNCVFSIGYSYWNNLNAHTGSRLMYVFLGLDRNRGGTGPTLFSYDKVSDEVRNLGPLLPPEGPFAYLNYYSGEGWYFSARAPTKLYIHDAGSRLLRFDIITKEFQVVFDARARFGPDKTIWQIHSSDDDRTHSATLKRLPDYEDLGCFVFREDTGEYFYFPKVGTNFNECQIDKSGRWLLILEDVDGLYGEENRIIDMETGTEKLILDQNGAVGHFDSGFGYLVGHDNWGAYSSTIKLWRYQDLPLEGMLVSHTLPWGQPNGGGLGHFAHANARPGVPVEQQYVCGSNARLHTAAEPAPHRSNEVTCIRLDASNSVLVVAPVMTDMAAPGGGDEYGKLPRGNIDVTGRYLVWASNMASDRLDVFLVKIPAERLLERRARRLPPPSASDSVPPTIVLTSPTEGSVVAGAGVMVSAYASDNGRVSSVRFKLDGADLGAELTAPPYAVLWDTTTVAEGAHTLLAIAHDSAGNVAASKVLNVTVSSAVRSPMRR